MKNSICCQWLPVLCIFVMFSCAKNGSDLEVDYNVLSNLPKDDGGTHTPYTYNWEVNPYGYYIYLPSGYASNKAEYPLLVFLHGAGEVGNSANNSSLLSKVLVNGPPKLIKEGKWSPRYPMIVVSPQCHEGRWNPGKVHRLIKQICNEYRINRKRIYLTGLSMGGFGTFSYIESYADSAYIAAAVPICGGGDGSKARAYKKIPLWAFHGDNDNTVYPWQSIFMVDYINEASPVYKAKVTIYPGVGHDSWSRTYDGTGMGTESPDYDSFDRSIYDWMFKYTK